jgi:hypothetical protein
MASGYSIAGIGNPMLGLGNFGLGSTTGFGSYDSYMPSMMGMGSIFGSGSYGGYGNYGSMMGMSPMMGTNSMIYYPTIMAQQQEAIEKMQLQHAADMHAGVTENEVKANHDTHSAFVQKVLEDADIQRGVQALYDKVKEGDQDGICKQFDTLKQYIYTTYKDELSARNGKINPAASAVELINKTYNSIITAQTNELHDLETDIKKYGDGPLMNGFRSGYERGNHERYVDQTLNHCLGLQIDRKESKDTRKAIGNVAGHVASVGRAAAIGGAVGAGAYVGLGGIASITKKTFGGKLIKFSPSTMGKFAVGAAILGAIGDVIWQMSDQATT